MWKGNDWIFRTYVRGDASDDGKRPAKGIRLKGKKHINTWDEVQSESCFGALMYPDFVDISFDDKEMYSQFLDMADANEWKCLALPSTKGGHTYWRKPDGMKLTSGADKHLAVGLIADVHQGDTYIPLQVHGVQRFPPDYDVLAGEDYQVLPEELWVLDTSINLWHLKAGDGRNDTLFKYILCLQNQLDLPEEEIKKILHNTNKFIFSEPVDESEFNTIMRAESFQKPSFFNGTTFKHNVFGDWMIKENNVVKINGQLCIYHDGYYQSGHQQIEAGMIKEIPRLKDSQRKEVMKYMYLKAETKQISPPRYIAFANGVYDRNDGQLHGFSPEYVIENKVPWDYSPGAYSEIMDHTLDELACHDPEIRALLEECVGYCLYRNNRKRKAFIMTGGRRNGKSTFLDCIKALLGEENIAALDLSEVGDRFNTAMLAGKLCNIGDDISDDFLTGNQAALFKKIVAGNRIKAERKGYDPFEFNPYVKMIFSANQIPRIKDRTGAVLDRLIIVPFDAYFGEDDAKTDTDIIDKLTTKESMEYLILLGLEGLKRIMSEGGGFTQAGKVKEQIAQYDALNNPVIGFIQEEALTAEDLINVPVDQLFSDYRHYCDSNNLGSGLGKQSFSQQIQKRLGLETIISKIPDPSRTSGRRSCRIYKIRSKK